MGERTDVTKRTNVRTYTQPGKQTNRHIYYNIDSIFRTLTRDTPEDPKPKAEKESHKETKDKASGHNNIISFKIIFLYTYVIYLAGYD